MFCGQVTGIKELIMYQGKTLDELKTDFEYAIDDYLLYCFDEQIEPNKTEYEDLNLQIPLVLKKNLEDFSAKNDRSIEEVVEEAIRNYIV